MRPSMLCASGEKPPSRSPWLETFDRDYQNVLAESDTNPAAIGMRMHSLNSYVNTRMARHRRLPAPLLGRPMPNMRDARRSLVRPKFQASRRGGTPVGNLAVQKIGRAWFSWSTEIPRRHAVRFPKHRNYGSAFRPEHRLPDGATSGPLLSDERLRLTRRW